MILAFSDMAWNGLFGALATIIVAWIVHHKVNKAVEKVVEVKKELLVSSEKQEEKIDAVAVVAEKTLTNVNGRMGLQLKLVAVSARRLAQITKNPVDRMAADLAEKLLAEHEKEQEMAAIGNISPM